MDETQWFHEAASQGCWNHMALHFLFCLPGGNHCSSSQPWTCLPAEHRPCSSQGPGKAKTRQRTSTAGSPLTTQETPDFVLIQCWRPLCPHQLPWDQDPFPSPFATAPPHSLSSSDSSVLSASLVPPPYLITATKLL